MLQLLYPERLEDVKKSKEQETGQQSKEIRGDQAAERGEEKSEGLSCNFISHHLRRVRSPTPLTGISRPESEQGCQDSKCEYSGRSGSKGDGVDQNQCDQAAPGSGSRGQKTCSRKCAGSPFDPVDTSEPFRHPLSDLELDGLRPKKRWLLTIRYSMPVQAVTMTTILMNQPMTKVSIRACTCSAIMISACMKTPIRSDA